MHSSRMRTGRSLTVFRSLQPGEGVCTWLGGVPGPGGGLCLVPGGYLVLGGVPGPRGGVPGPGGCTWSWGGVPGPGWVPGPGGMYLVLGGVPGPWGCTWSRGVYLVRGVPGPGGGCTWSQGGWCTWSGGVYLVWRGVPGPGGVYLVRYPPPVNRMTNRCKNIILAKTSFRPVIIEKNFYKFRIDLFHWRIYEVKFWTLIPLSVQFSSFSCSFQKKLPK